MLLNYEISEFEFAIRFVFLEYICDFSFLLSTACTDKELYCNQDLEQNLLTDDADCDGALTADDCDDTNSALGLQTEDADNG